MEQLLANLAVIGKAQPELAEKFRHYQPQTVTAAPDAVDLLRDSERFYGMDARQACQAQVAQYVAKPTHYSLRYRVEEKPIAQHQVVINQLITKAKTLNYPQKPTASTLLMFGGGMGFQLQCLTEQQGWRHIILVEPDDDMLYHCLCHIDVDALTRHCQDRGGVFTIIQPKDVAQFNGQMADMAKHLGYSLYAEVAYYRHYETDFFNEVFHNIKAIRHQWLSTWGFFDDEVMGLDHTLANARNGHPFFCGEAKGVNVKPVLLVGNGPSLDDDLSLINANRGKFIVASCGTAIAPLIKAGIRPDIHFEMERSPALYELLEPWISEQVSNNTVLFALNTVAPKLVSAFKHSYLFSKANDLGTRVIQTANKGGVEALYFSNPTVTNLATSALVSLGCRQILMVGCDYGYKDPNRHHASGSDYYKPGSMIAHASFESELQVPGNFGGVVGTERIFNLSRKNVEAVLVRNPKVDCINCSDGANIEGAEAMRFSDYIASGRAATAVSIDGLLAADEFVDMNISDEQLVQPLKNGVDHLTQLRSKLSEVNSNEQLHDLLSGLTRTLGRPQKQQSGVFFVVWRESLPDHHHIRTFESYPRTKSPAIS